jgi:hypothetical protein
MPCEYHYLLENMEDAYKIQTKFCGKSPPHHPITVSYLIENSDKVLREIPTTTTLSDRILIEPMCSTRLQVRPYGTVNALLSYPRGGNIIVRRTDGRAKRNSKKNVTTKRVILYFLYTRQEYRSEFSRATYLYEEST